MSEVRQWTPIWDECEGWLLEGVSQFPSGRRVVLKDELDSALERVKELEELYDNQSARMCEMHSHSEMVELSEENEKLKAENAHLQTIVDFYNAAQILEPSARFKCIQNFLLKINSKLTT